VKYAKKLAKELNADSEIVEIAGWLHDVGSIVEGRENHHVSSARIAEKLLTSLGYPKERIERVKHCILNHRGSVNNKRISLEEKIVSDADAMSNFDNLPGIFKAAFTYEKLGQGEAKISVRNKLANKYKQLNFNKSKELIRPRYEAAMLLLK
jgi:uncharacterized protein